jgi:hypothetical protein
MRVTRMKTLAFCTGVLFALSVNAQGGSRAALIGQHTSRAFADGPLLICEYAGATAKFEILSQNGKCAPFINVQ